MYFDISFDEIHKISINLYHIIYKFPEMSFVAPLPRLKIHFASLYRNKNESKISPQKTYSAILANPYERKRIKI